MIVDPTPRLPRRPRSIRRPCGELRLIIVAPKEKLAGSRFTKLVVIHSQSGPFFCHLAAFPSYCSRLASVPIRNSHPVLDVVTLNYRFRHTDDSSSPVSVSTIGRYINSIMEHLGLPAQAPLPKARALGSTLAAKAGLSVDDIMAHGSWSYPAMFCTFYRLTSASATDFTFVTLDQQARFQSGQCNIM
ncbi:unnamed protein product [Absidia cylindrospora]